MFPCGHQTKALVALMDGNYIDSAAVTPALKVLIGDRWHKSVTEVGSAEDQGPVAASAGSSSSFSSSSSSSCSSSSSSSRQRPSAIAQISEIKRNLALATKRMEEGHPMTHDNHDEYSTSLRASPFWLAGGT
jgi:hypothetical protein